MTTRYLVTGAGGNTGGVSDAVIETLVGNDAVVRAFVHHDDHRADALRTLGAEVMVGDLTEPADVVAAHRRCGPDVLQHGRLAEISGGDRGGRRRRPGAGRTSDDREHVADDGVPDVADGGDESTQQRLHWLSEQILDWSGCR